MKGIHRAIAALGIGFGLTFAAAFGGTDAQSQVPARSRAMALTFDDLPFVAAGRAYFPDATRATTDLLRVLRQHRAPAIGFVNEGQLDAGGENRDRREALLAPVD